MEIFFYILDVGLSLGDIIMRTCFCPCGQVYLAVCVNPMGHFFGI